MYVKYYNGKKVLEIVCLVFINIYYIDLFRNLLSFSIWIIANLLNCGYHHEEFTNLQNTNGWFSERGRLANHWKMVQLALLGQIDGGICCFLDTQQTKSYGIYQFIALLEKMGACLIANNLRQHDNSTQPSPLAFRAEIQAQLQQIPQKLPLPLQKEETKIQQKIVSKHNLNNSKHYKRSSIHSKQQLSRSSLPDSDTENNNNRSIKQVIINTSLNNLAEKTLAVSNHSKGSTISVREETIKPSSDEDEKNQEEEEFETPISRIHGACDSMLGKGLTDTDNRMIALTLNVKEPLKLTAVRLKNGSIYSGEWLAGKRHGKGLLLWDDGSKYEGDWFQNYSQGKGKLTYGESECYEGDFVKNCRHGNGKYVCFGMTYTGQWHDDRQEGFGIEEWGKGEYYKGQWMNGHKNGYGEFYFDDGSFYCGEFSSNQIHGNGLYHWKGVKTYQGQWQHNRMSGKGVLTFENGQKYDGFFKNDKYHGEGRLTHSDGSFSIGIFQQGKKHGKFNEIDPSGKSKITQYYLGKKGKYGQDGMKFKRLQESFDSKTQSSVIQSV